MASQLREDPQPGVLSSSLGEMEIYAFLLAAQAEECDGDGVRQHISRVSELVGRMVRLLGVQDAPERRLWATGSFLHDVGKMHVSREVLRKPGALDAFERKLVEGHSEYGYNILKEYTERLKETAEFWAISAEIALTHHENWDGSGYPGHLVGSDIPMVGRVVRLADVFDALTSPRVYHAAISKDEAVRRMHSEEFRGVFDPQLFEVFLSALDLPGRTLGARTVGV